MKHLFFMFLFLGFFSARGQENAVKDTSFGQNFVGSWQGLTDTSELLFIARDGGNYILSKFGVNTTFTLSDKVLKNDNPANGTVIYNSLNGHIFWLKKEYEPSQVAPVGAIGNAQGVASAQGTPTPADTSTGPVVYTAATVKDFFGDNINSPENQLFKFTADYRSSNLFYFDINMHEQLQENQNVANEILAGFLATGRFSRIDTAQINSVLNDTISYFVGYANINIRYRESVQSNGGVSYHAIISANIQVKNSVGMMLIDQVINTRENGLMRYFSSMESAVKQSAEALGKDVTSYLNKVFHIVTTVKAVDDVNKKGEAKTIIINGGENMGIYKPGLLAEEFGLVIRENGIQIGRVHVRSVDANTSICKVEEGGTEIAAAIAAGKKLEAVSE